MRNAATQCNITMSRDTGRKQYTFFVHEDDYPDLVAFLDSIEPGLRSFTIRKMLMQALRQQSAASPDQIRAIVEEAVGAAMEKFWGKSHET